MNRDKKNFDEVLDRHLGLYKASSRQRVEGEQEAMLSRIRGRAEVEVSPFSEPTKSSRPWSIYVFAAAAVVAVAVIVFVGVHNNSMEAFAAVAAGPLARPTGEIVAVGEKIAAGEVLRTNKSSSAIALADARVEIRPQSEFRWEHADDGARIHLKEGAVIANVTQGNGNLYVQTKDAQVSGAGSVFVVVGEEAGSRVAVIQGEVQVQQGSTLKKLLPGEQMTTNRLMESHPVTEQIAWSGHSGIYLAMLQQSAGASVTPKPLQFEVASLREEPIDLNVVPASFFGCRGVDGVWSPEQPLSVIARPADYGSAIPQGRCIASSLSRGYISVAYDIPGVRISGDEDYVWHFRIEAKADDPSTATKEQLHQMLQNLIIDRFKLKVHRYTQEVQGYVLTVAKNGSKLKEATGDEETPLLTVPSGQRLPFAIGALRPRVISGKFGMRKFTSVLSGPVVLGKPVVDKTELYGLFDIHLLLNLIPSPPGEGPRGGGNSNGAGPERFDPPLSRALEEQLGLHLEPFGKVPLEYLVVDHIEKPSEN